MNNSHYFTEFMVRERQRQLVAEADSLRLIKTGKSKGTKNRKRISGTISNFINIIGAHLHRKTDPSVCLCSQG